MSRRFKSALAVILALSCGRPALTQDKPPDSELLARLAEDESRIKSLEVMIAELTRRLSAAPPPEAQSPIPLVPSLATAAVAEPAESGSPVAADPDAAPSHDHMMEIPGGPVLHFRGFSTSIWIKDQSPRTFSIRSALRVTPAFVPANSISS